MKWRLTYGPDNGYARETTSIDVTVTADTLTEAKALAGEAVRKARPDGEWIFGSAKVLIDLDQGPEES